jgi:membrane protease YdiL (CAAX protease family)
LTDEISAELADSGADLPPEGGDLPPAASALGAPAPKEGGSHGISAGSHESPPPVSRLDSGPPAQRRAIAIAELILCSSVPTQLLLQAIMMGAGWNPRSPTGGFSLSFVVTMSLADTALLIVLMVMLTRAHGESVAALWLGRRKVWKETLLGIALVPPIFLLVVIVLNTVRLFVPALHNVETNPLEEMATGGMMNAAAFGLVAIFAGGLREELQRAFLLRRFEQHLGGEDVGVLVLSVAFGLGHLVQGWDAAIATGVLGAVWAVLYVKRRSSVAPLVSHAGFNSLEVLRIALVGG